ncbi:cupin domain-containing protein [Halioglobus maricola]|uniref:Cupin domain-containing protein n=1 Tax=Halioglobus maricola TaxID=2601894 RepID=A0A5P9NJE9_9GAMM|nr:cupin domain-containing protein [Halioglobus maricola]QFU76003.1 cupin domain-containing protein [Halioglobus maricola]
MTLTAGAELKLDREEFLARYWQQRPLLMRGAIPAFEPPISRHELAGLAFESDVESRIIDTRGDNWELLHGPFSEADYQRSNPWTLLVQAVDHHVPAVAHLRRLVDFIPSWRVDDVMVSYAVDGGSVGPHYDNYDVFLVQGEGRRRWQVGQHCDSSTPLLPHEDLRILSDFQLQDEFLLETGDILYLPPGVAHWGVAEGECTTFSIGFRAPRVDDLVSRFADALLADSNREEFYHDARLEPASRAGEIRPRDLERVRAQLLAALDQPVDDGWFGELVTEPRYDVTPEEDELTEQLALLDTPGVTARLAPESKLAWQQVETGIAVYANGGNQTFPQTILDVLSQLCSHWQLDSETLARALGQPVTRDLLHYLLESGSIYVE